ncbi:MAG: histidine phosphatase family protein [Ruminococcus sp.]
MKGYRISVIRHGRTAANDKGIYIGRTDFPLSDKGAAELAGKMDEFQYPNVARVYSSPLRRCTETAEILFPDVQIQTVDNLIEMDFGAFEGKSADELVEKPEFKEWLKGGMDCRPPQGERQGGTAAHFQGAPGDHHRYDAGRSAALRHDYPRRHDRQYAGRVRAAEDLAPGIAVPAG